MALHVISTTSCFRDALIKIVNIRGDADSVGSVVGQIAGALYGIGGDKGIPLDWIKTVQRWDNGGEIALKAHKLFYGRTVTAPAQASSVSASCSSSSASSVSSAASCSSSCCSSSSSSKKTSSSSSGTTEEDDEEEAKEATSSSVSPNGSKEATSSSVSPNGSKKRPATTTAIEEVESDEEEQDDKGGYVNPSTHCQHAAANIGEIDLAQAQAMLAQGCADCGSKAENWWCMLCRGVFCSRYVNKHMFQHAETTGHRLGASLSDLNTWCYACETYVTNPRIREVTALLQKAKFG